MKIGILGGGQLGRMLTLAGYPLGIHCTCYEEASGTSASHVGEVDNGSITNQKHIEAWARRQDVLTYEWENYPAELVGHLAEIRPVHPNVKALATAQDRWQEKILFDELDIPVPPFRFASSEEEIRKAADELDFPFVVKTRTGGYDGKGQVVVRSEADIAAAVQLSTHSPVIAETFVEFTSEVSIIGVRASNGDMVTYPLTHNVHRDGILRVSTVPAPVDGELEQSAHVYMGAIMKRLQYTGVLALELFVTPRGLLANEMAPRVHNSGHWTQDGAETSQFENHLRAIAGLPLGSTALRCPTAMVNCIGQVPPAASVLAIPGAHLHTYDKEPRPGRKVGHINVIAPNTETLAYRVEQVEALLVP